MCTNECQLCPTSPEYITVIIVLAVKINVRYLFSYSFLIYGEKETRICRHTFCCHNWSISFSWTMSAQVPCSILNWRLMLLTICHHVCIFRLFLCAITITNIVMLCLGDLIIASDRTFLNYLVSLLLLLVKSSYKFYWSLPGVGMPSPRSLPGGGHAWSQVPSLVPGPFQGVGMPDPRSLVRGMFTMGTGYVQAVGWVYQRARSVYTRGAGYKRG